MDEITKFSLLYFFIALVAIGGLVVAILAYVKHENNGTTVSQKEGVDGTDASISQKEDANVGKQGPIGPDGKDVEFNNGTKWIFATQRNQIEDKASSSGFMGSKGSVATNSDGTVIVIGSFEDSNKRGSFSIYKRDGQVWKQFGNKLVSSVFLGPKSKLGYSVAISDSGNTIAVGGPEDDNGAGSCFIFEKVSNKWVEQEKLTSYDFSKDSNQGVSLAISGDGDTLVIGADNSNGGIGSVCIWTRRNHIWSEKQSLTPEEEKTCNFGNSLSVNKEGTVIAVGSPKQGGGEGVIHIFKIGVDAKWYISKKLTIDNSVDLGINVDLDSKGTTLVAGCPQNGCAYVWKFTDDWNLSAGKLMGIGGTGKIQSCDVSISGEGDVIVIGSNGDGFWVFGLKDSIWSQCGKHVFGTGGTGSAQGSSVTICREGGIVIVSDPTHNTGDGCVWVFERIK